MRISDWSSDVCSSDLYDNNYGGAVKRLNAITAELAELNVASAPVFLLNGLKREELIATNSMILHEVYFDSLGGSGAVSAEFDAVLEIGRASCRERVCQYV